MASPCYGGFFFTVGKVRGSNGFALLRRLFFAVGLVILVRFRADRGGIAKSRDFWFQPVGSGLEKHRRNYFLTCILRIAR
jgi:hypothetical protein